MRHRAEIRERLHICLDMDGFDLTWSEGQVEEFREMWKEGASLGAMARYFKRDLDEVAILVVDQSRRGRIKKRPGGYRGKGAA